MQCEARTGDELLSSFTSVKGAVKRMTVNVENEALTKLEEISSEKGWRIHEALFSIFMLSVYEVFEQKEITISLPVTGRYMPESIGIIGSFTSSLPVAFHVEEGGSLQAVESVIEQLRQFYKHEQLSQGQLLKELGGSYVQLLDTIPFTFAFQDIRKRPTKFGDLKLTQVDIPRDQLEYPIEAWVRIESQGLLINVDYDEGRAKQDVAQTLIDKMYGTLQDLINDRMTADKAVPQTQSTERQGIWRRLFG